VSAASTPITADVEAPQRFTLRQRIALSFITWAGYLAIRVIGPTLRYSISREEGAPPLNRDPYIYGFWHRCVFPAAWLWHDYGIHVMTSRSFDGEYIARIIGKLGFVAVRGSSSRGALAALLGLRSAVERGSIAAFTIDGPRGPKYVAKPGAAMLARMTGAPVGAFHIAVERAWVLKTWDSLMIPKPFSRVLMRAARGILIPPDATEEQMKAYQGEVQAALDRTTAFAEMNVAKVGAPEFPLVQYGGSNQGRIVIFSA
jgi:lysophospholipid acyltransferase (LPLAT)-like uncharacterized protein